MKEGGVELVQPTVIAELCVRDACTVRSLMPFTQVHITPHETQLYMPRASASLHDLIARRTRFSSIQLKGIAISIGAHLADLHAAGFSHNDVRPPNILVIASLNKYLMTDAGLARPILAPIEDDMVMCSRTKPPGLMGQREKVDGWGMGICLLACVAQDWYMTTKDNTLPKDIVAQLADLDPELRGAILGLLNIDEDARFTPTTAMKLLGHDEVIKPVALWSVPESMLSDSRLTLALSRAKRTKAFVKCCAEPLRRLLLWELSTTNSLNSNKLYTYMVLALLIYGYDIEALDMLKSMAPTVQRNINSEVMKLVKRGALKASRLPRIVVTSDVPCKRRLL